MAYEILSELRSSDEILDLYDCVYCLVLDKAILLRQLLSRAKLTEKKLFEMYDYVQMKYNVIPRCYLMIIIGHLIIRSNTQLFKTLSSELTKANNAVLSPVTGMYLRRFLVENITSLGIKSDQSVDCLLMADFVLDNFAWLNRLWVNLGHRSEIHSTDNSVHSRMALFMYSCVNRLLEIVDHDRGSFKDRILPAMLKEIVNCKHAPSQNMLFWHLIDSFEPELIISNSCLIFTELGNLDKEFDFCHFITRYCSFVKSHASSSPPTLSISSVANETYLNVIRLTDLPSKFSTQDSIALLTPLLTLAVLDPVSMDSLLNNVLNQAKQLILKVKFSEIVHNLKFFIFAFLKSGVSLLAVMQSSILLDFISRFELRDRIVLISMLPGNISDNDSVFLRSPNDLEALLRVIKMLLAVDEPSENGSNSNESCNSLKSAFKTVSRMLNFARPENAETLLNFCKESFSIINQAGSSCHQSTFPTIICVILHNLKILFEPSSENIESFKKLFELCFLVLSTLKEPCFYLAIQNYLLAALYSYSLNHPPFYYFTERFLQEGFTLFEERITSLEQLSCLVCITNCLSQLTNLDPETFYRFCSQAAKNSSNFTSYINRCQGAIIVSWLYWTAHKNGLTTTPALDTTDTVCSCLNTAAKTIESCIGESTKLTLWTNLMWDCLYFMEEGCPNIDCCFVDLIEVHLTGEYESLRGTNKFSHHCSQALKVIDFYHKLKARLK